MSIINFAKAVYHYFVPEKETVADIEEHSDDGHDSPVDQPIDSPLELIRSPSDEEYDTELDIQRNERKKAKHEMKKKQARINSRQ